MHTADWQDRCSNRLNDEAGTEILSDILDIISDMPSYGYRRMRCVLRKQRRPDGLPPVNAKRFYRIMFEHKLLYFITNHSDRIVSIRAKSRWQKAIYTGVQMASSSAATEKP